MGTPSYMAPEQAAAAKEIGPAADVYGLGAILYDLLVSRPPFQAASTFDTLVQVVGMDPVPPRRLDSSIPVELETICLKCLEKRPERRYASAQDLAADLRRYLEDRPIRARPPGVLQRLIKFAVRNPLPAALLCLGLSVGSVVLRTFLSLDAQTLRAVAGVVRDFAWNSAQTTFVILAAVSIYGAVYHARHRPRLAETVWRCVILWLVVKVLCNLILPLVP
jgi:hypothetical protein